MFIRINIKVTIHVLHPPYAHDTFLSQFFFYCNKKTKQNLQYVKFFYQFVQVVHRFCAVLLRFAPYLSGETPEYSICGTLWHFWPLMFQTCRTSIECQGFAPQIRTEGRQHSFGNSGTFLRKMACFHGLQRT